MSDVRSLLRQQREARRIDHIHAAYSDAGKLLCTLCREPIKTEAVWDAHIRSATHRQNAQRALAAAGSRKDGVERKDHAETGSRGQQGSATENTSNEETDAAGGPESTMASHPKRKHNGEDYDDSMEDAVRRKRSRPDISEASTRSDSDKETRQHRSNSETLTPPSLTRRASTTPSQGVELQIPSRPATPSHRDESSASTLGPGPLTGTANIQPADRPGKGLPALGTTSGNGESSTTPSTEQVNESEWAAFEADIAAASAPYAEDATISAPAMTAKESAAAAQAAQDGEGNDASKRKTKADVDLEDEKEEATRALEEEFEDMEELEARVQRLRDKRESIRRKRSESQGQATAPPPTKLNGVGKENMQGTIDVAAAVDEVEEEDDDDEDDDWDNFRLRGR